MYIVFESNIGLNSSTSSYYQPQWDLRLVFITYQVTLRWKTGEKWATTAGYSQKLCDKCDKSLLCKLCQSQSERSLCNIWTKSHPWHHQGVPTFFSAFLKSIYPSLSSKQQKISNVNEFSELKDYLSFRLNFSCNVLSISLLWADGITPNPRRA